MKLVAIAGSIGEQSYNRMLLQFIAKHFSDLVQVEILNIDDVPVFNQDEDLSDSVAVQAIYQKLFGADGVILATPEHNHTISAAMKNVIEWMSYQLHPLDGKPVLVVGASYFDQGTSRAQLHLKQILESPGVNAIVMPGNEFLLRNAKEAFDEAGQLKDEGTVKFLGLVIQKFMKFVRVIDMLDAPNPKSYEEEDLEATGKVNTTIEGVDMDDPDWVNKAAEKVHAVEGSTYVKLDHGVLTVDQLNYFLKTMPAELTYVDDNNQFIYYNRTAPGDQMLASRLPEQAGNPMSAVHPDRAIDHVKQVIYALRTGATDLVSMPVPGNDENHHDMHYYQAMRDENGRYRGINEWVLDIMPVIKYFLASTGQKLVKDPDAKPFPPITGVDIMSSASKKPSAPAADVTSGASEEPQPEPEVKPEVDATSGASEH
jgi:NAD(P)H-dependent FMN reductase